MGTIEFRKPVGASSSTTLQQAFIAKLQGSLGNAEGAAVKSGVRLWSKQSLPVSLNVKGGRRKGHCTKAVVWQTTHL